MAKLVALAVVREAQEALVARARQDRGMQAVIALEMQAAAPEEEEREVLVVRGHS